MNWEVSTALMCRACMEIDGTFISMDDETVNKKNLLRKLTELTSIHIDKNDGLPTMLCTKCAHRTNAFYKFKQQVIESEKKLRRMFEVSNDSVKDICETRQDRTVLESSQAAQMKNHILKVTKKEINPIVEEMCFEPQNIQLVKTAKDEITNIMNSDGVHYAITYIPDDTINIMLNREAIQAVLANPEISLESTPSKYTEPLPSDLTNGDIDDLSSFETDATEPVKEADEKAVQSREDVKNPEIEVIFSKTGPTSNENTVFIAGKENTDSKRENLLDSEDSDSDYFINSKDDILGSLNDTITRVKEIKMDGDQIEFQCTLCLQNYEELSKVLIHIVENHVPSNGPFFCIVCEKDCESRRELRAHVKIHTGSYPYICFLCKKAYTMKRYLKRHLSCHTDFPRHRCAKCGVRYKIKSELETHLTTHAHAPAYQCSQCPRIFNNKGNYKRHLMSHLDPLNIHLPKFPCRVCGKRFVNNRTLQTHLRVHTGEKPFKCMFCGRMFSQQGNLLNHMKSVHSNPRSHTCEVCGKSFNQKATLKDHSLLHTGEKPYVCTVCGMAFTFSSAMRRHMWVHSGGKPFGCDICQARFIGKYDLKRHMKIHLQKPKLTKKRNPVNQNDTVPEELMEEIIVLEDSPETGQILMEQILLPHDTTQINLQKESEKENVDALFNLIQYG